MTLKIGLIGLDIGAVGNVTISSATLSAAGGVIINAGSGGGSGGGLAVFGGGGVSFSSATLTAAGGSGRSFGYYPLPSSGYGGGGGRVVVGYGPGTTAPDITFINVNGGGSFVSGGAGLGGDGSPGVKNTVSFAGF